MKLFTVTIETEVVVVADNGADAKAIALRAVQSGEHDVFTASAFPFSGLPAGWGVGCIPYGDGDPADPNRTIQQWLALENDNGNNQ